MRFSAGMWRCPRDRHAPRRLDPPAQRGAMRSAPSSRMTSPLSIRFSTMCVASCAYSAGRPRRGGNGIDLPSDSRASGGAPPAAGCRRGRERW